MNLATPILIGDPSFEFRSLLRDMLTKHGFFHIIEATTQNEILHFIENEKKKYFTLIQSGLLNDEIVLRLSHQKNFLIIAQADRSETIALAARLGVRNFLSFPFSSMGLFEKLKEIFQ